MKPKVWNLNEQLECPKPQAEVVQGRWRQSWEWYTGRTRPSLSLQPHELAWQAKCQVKNGVGTREVAELPLFCSSHTKREYKGVMSISLIVFVTRNCILGKWAATLCYSLCQNQVNKCLVWNKCLHLKVISLNIWFLELKSAASQLWPFSFWYRQTNSKFLSMFLVVPAGYRPCGLGNFTLSTDYS